MSPAEVRITVKDKETKTTVQITATVSREGAQKLMKDTMAEFEKWRSRTTLDTAAEP